MLPSTGRLWVNHHPHHPALTYRARERAPVHLGISQQTAKGAVRSIYLTSVCLIVREVTSVRTMRSRVLLFRAQQEDAVVRSRWFQHLEDQAPAKTSRHDAHHHQ
jgi:hypothetical protein